MCIDLTFFSNTTDKQYGDGVSLQTKYEDIVKCIDFKKTHFLGIMKTILK